MHPCEAIVLSNRSLTFERCTRFRRPEADRGCLRGREPLHQAPSGAAAKQRGVNVAVVPFERSENKKKSPVVARQPGTQRTAATYSPNWWVSTIGDGELNFSVRNGKRWILTAITTVVCYLREKNQFGEPSGPLDQQSDFSLVALLRNFSAIFPLGKSLGQLVQVC